MALQSGTQGAGAAIKQIVIALINGENADPNLRNEVGGNLTIIQGALADLSSYVYTRSTHNQMANCLVSECSNDNSTSGLLGMAQTEFLNSVNAANGVVNNCK